MGGAQHVMLEQCGVQIDEMQGAADRRAPDAGNPEWGCRRPGPPKNFPFFGAGRCRATQQIGYLHKQCSALHVKDHQKMHQKSR